MTTFNRLICYVMGHRRGIRHGQNNGEYSYPASWTMEAALEANRQGKVIFMCPRCLATWTRKVKAKTIS